MQRVSAKVVLLSYLAAATVFLILALLVPKGSEFAGIEPYRNFMADEFFKFGTRLGEAIFISAMLLVIIAFHSVAEGAASVILVIAMAITVNLLKHSVFPEYDRPVIYMQQLHRVNLNAVPGTELWRNNSFPSGHTAAAFTICALFSLVSRRVYIVAGFFCIAILVGLSRMYLMQHFLVDVCAGSFIGTGFAACLLLLRRTGFYKRLPQRPIFAYSKQ
jgi:membrane-associated phospholipid phosphatase